jgi:hypothetical protein
MGVEINAIILLAWIMECLYIYKKYIINSEFYLILYNIIKNIISIIYNAIKVESLIFTTITVFV